MFVNDVLNKDELSIVVINELKQLGIKYSKKREKNKLNQEKLTKKRIFRTNLHNLELTDVVLSNREICQIPSFVDYACQRILSEITEEGLFRKAGSSIRQKEIKTNLEAGLQLGKNHHIIDVANVLKTFFRELPEPLLPGSIQETLLRSLLVSEGKIKGILMSCLLLPPLTINTLAYFMQFLRTVSLSSQQNRMTIENLAIIFTPSLMPLNDLTGIRFNNHVKIIQLLIQHSEMIGVVPEKIITKLKPESYIIQETSSISTNILVESCATNKRKKKRRSGSLTRVFNGIKKIVGAIGSSESLEETPDMVVTTPCITKSVKKRKLAEQASAFSAKKKKEIIQQMPSCDILPNTSGQLKESKKPRISLGGLRNLKSLNNNTVERRWSLVGSGWSKRKLHSSVSNIEQNKKSSSDLPKPLSPVLSMPNLPKIDLEDFSAQIPSFSISSTETSILNNKSLDEDFVKISKSEYEAIKERVESLEKRISKEFCTVTSMLSDDDNSKLEHFSNEDIELTGPEKVANKFHKINETTSSQELTPSAILARRISKELQIRRSDRIVRSPSARKIGSIRRRSRESLQRNNTQLTRNATWHISSTRNMTILKKLENQLENEKKDNINTTVFYPKSNLKRGRPNTIQTGLNLKTQSNYSLKKSNESHDNEHWVDGEIFFNNVSEIKENSPKTPFITKIEINRDEMKTPMLPPRSIPRQNGFKTPGKSVAKQKISMKLFQKSPMIDTDGIAGRASIALLAANTGHVMAKARLFDNVIDPEKVNVSSFTKINNFTRTNSTEARSCKSLVTNTNKINTFQLKSSPSSIIKNQNKIVTTGKSPGKIMKYKQQRKKQHPNSQILARVIGDETILSPNNKVREKFKKIKNNIIDSPRRTPQTPIFKKSLSVNPSRKILFKTPHKDDVYSTSKLRTPLKAVRSSPRLNP